jgi:membrane-bound ClpP family serine protease
MHSISKGRLSRSKLVLNEALNQKPDSDSEDLSYFVGKVGKTHTALRPAGIAEFDGVKLNVVSDGDFVNTQKSVRIERVEGNRIVVRECDAEDQSR